MYKKISKLGKMIINIHAYGKKKIWEDIEETKDPLLRCSQRKLYAQAIKKIADTEGCD